MKIKVDFISNSSSTSFVYIANGDLTEESFLNAAAIDKNGPLGDLFCQMYHEINSALKNHGEIVSSKESADKFLGSHMFTRAVVEKMKEAIDQGKKVITSTLSSDGRLAESLMCMEMFEIESDSFYINAYNNYW